MYKDCEHASASTAGAVMWCPNCGAFRAPTTWRIPLVVKDADNLAAVTPAVTDRERELEASYDALAKERDTLLEEGRRLIGELADARDVAKSISLGRESDQAVIQQHMRRAKERDERIVELHDQQRQTEQLLLSQRKENASLMVGFESMRQQLAGSKSTLATVVRASGERDAPSLEALAEALEKEKRLSRMAIGVVSDIERLQGAVKRVLDLYAGRE